MNIDSALRLLDRRPDPVAGADAPSDALAPLLHVLGDPQLAAPVLLVSGHRDAGAVVRMATELLRAQGLSVGTLAATHLERVEERLAWDGTDVDSDALGVLVGDVAAVEELAGVTATASDIVAAAAFRWFAEVAVDVAVVEAGPTRGSALSAVAAVVEPIVDVRTDASPVPEIVTPEGVWVRDEDFGVSVDKVAVGGRLLDLRTPEARHDEIYVPVHGAHQAESAALAVAAVEAFLGRPQDPEVVTEAFGGLTLPGRFEVVARHPTVVVDQVHDVEGAAATAATLAEDMTLPGSVLMVVGLEAGPDPAEVLVALGVADAGLVVTTTPATPGAVSSSALASMAERMGAVAEAGSDPVDAVRRALAVATEDDLVLVTGSPRVSGPIRAALRHDDRHDDREVNA